MDAERSPALYSWSGLRYYQNLPALLGSMKLPVLSSEQRWGGGGGGVALANKTQRGGGQGVGGKMRYDPCFSY